MPKILVLDDEPDVLFLIAAILKKNEYTVQTANTKKEFLEKLSSFKPHLVILDAMVGKDSGRDICKEIKAAEYKHIPVILNSANPLMLENFEECEATDVIEKPYEIRELLKKIKKVL